MASPCQWSPWRPPWGPRVLASWDVKCMHYRSNMKPEWCVWTCRHLSYLWNIWNCSVGKVSVIYLFFHGSPFGVASSKLRLIPQCVYFVKASNTGCIKVISVIWHSASSHLAYTQTHFCMHDLRFQIHMMQSINGQWRSYEINSLFYKQRYTVYAFLCSYCQPGCLAGDFYLSKLRSFPVLHPGHFPLFHDVSRIPK